MIPKKEAELDDDLAEQADDVCDQLRREAEALIAISNALRGLSLENARRVVRAVAILQGIAL